MVCFGFVVEGVECCDVVGRAELDTRLCLLL